MAMVPLGAAMASGVEAFDVVVAAVAVAAAAVVALVAPKGVLEPSTLRDS